MSLAMKSWLVGLANAAISGIAAGSAALSVGVGWKKALAILAISAGVSLIKWAAQHPIPDPAKLQETLQTAKVANEVAGDAIAQAQQQTNTTKEKI